jgi:hypothetical protein
VTIICTTEATAGHVVLLLLECSLFPRTHFRLDQTDRHGVTITVKHRPAAAQEAQIRAELAAMDGVSIR